MEEPEFGETECLAWTHSCLNRPDKRVFQTSSIQANFRFCLSKLRNTRREVFFVFQRVSPRKFILLSLTAGAVELLNPCKGSNAHLLPCQLFVEHPSLCQTRCSNLDYYEASLRRDTEPVADRFCAKLRRRAILAC
ncbi:hypothetical protein KM043_003636 [Ampulex compressa]|nr:hypothetical protein KM043_003636 [Ampulex compressa]